MRRLMVRKVALPRPIEGRGRERLLPFREEAAGGSAFFGQSFFESRMGRPRE